MLQRSPPGTLIRLSVFGSSPAMRRFVRQSIVLGVLGISWGARLDETPLQRPTRFPNLPMSKGILISLVSEYLSETWKLVLQFLENLRNTCAIMQTDFVVSLPRSEVAWQHSPLATSLVDVEDGIHDVSKWIFTPLFLRINTFQ